jgi:hypothetical protein
MKVARHCNLGREAAYGAPIVAIAVKSCVVDALDRAHRFVTGHQRVFLNDHAGSEDRVEIDRPTPSSTTHTRLDGLEMKVHD